MSMAASIESRVPFLDHKLVEFSATVPSRSKIRRFAGKHIVKKALEGLLRRLESSTGRRWGSRCRGNNGCASRCSLPLSPCSSRSARSNAGGSRPKECAAIVAEHRSGRTNLSRQLWTTLGLEDLGSRVPRRRAQVPARDRGAGERGCPRRHGGCAMNTATRLRKLRSMSGLELRTRLAAAAYRV